MVLSKSHHFLRLAFAIHGFAIVMLCRSSLILFLKLSVLVILLYTLRAIFMNQSQFIPFKKLVFKHNERQLFDKDSQEFIYERHRVVLEAGIFFLLELSRSQEKKLLIIFFDQITVDDYRSLKLLEKVC